MFKALRPTVVAPATKQISSRYFSDRAKCSSSVRMGMIIPILTDDEHLALSEKYRDEICFVAGATTVGLRALNIAQHLGAIVGECHGFDSCYEPGQDGVKTQKLHAHP